MKIDVVLPTYNRSALLADAVESFLAATPPEDAVCRLVIANNNSRDETEATARRFVDRHPDRITYLFEARQGKHHALNAAIAASTADVIAFFDDDEILDPDWLRVIARRFGDPTLDYLGGEVRGLWEIPGPDWIPSGFNGVLGLVNNGEQTLQYHQPGFDGMLTGANAAIRKHVLGRCGPFSDRYMYAEDRYMHLQLGRIGARGIYDPALIVSHRVPAWRLTKKYWRHWAFNEGRVVARGNLETGLLFPSILGVPRWMWRRALQSVWRRMVRLGPSQRAVRFEAELRLIELYGYVTVATFGRADRYIDRTAMRK
jgi:glucosyl-dolichyl phosphate glucuronosyltransferase